MEKKMKIKVEKIFSFLFVFLFFWSLDGIRITYLFQVPKSVIIINIFGGFWSYLFIAVFILVSLLDFFYSLHLNIFSLIIFLIDILISIIISLFCYEIFELHKFLFASLNHILNLIELKNAPKFILDGAILFKIILSISSIVTNIPSVDASLNNDTQNSKHKNTCQVEIKLPGSCHTDLEIGSTYQLVWVTR